VLDGDCLRRTLSRDLSFSKADRDEHIRRVGFVASLLTRHGIIALVSVISPYREIRSELRAELGRFIEVHVNAPLAVCEARDVKGLYAKARSGRLEGLTGVGQVYEPPDPPEVECLTDRETVAESAAKVLARIEELFPEASLNSVKLCPLV
jgi:adenylylsulfate kinase